MGRYKIQNLYTTTEAGVDAIKGKLVGEGSKDMQLGEIAVYQPTGGTAADSALYITNADKTNIIPFYSGAKVENLIADFTGRTEGFATAAQGDLADKAVRKVEEGTANGTISVTTGTGAATDVAVHGLGSAAYTDSTAYATAAQGEKANTALQLIDKNGDYINVTAKDDNNDNKQIVSLKTQTMATADASDANTKGLAEASDVKGFVTGKVDAVKTELIGNTETDNASSNTIEGAKKYADAQIKASVTSVYKVKGTKATYADLPKTGNVEGDVWNVTEAHGNTPAGTNYVWIAAVEGAEGGESAHWDPLGGTIDLSSYATKAELLNNDDAVPGKFVTAVKQVDGKITVERAAISADNLPDIPQAKVVGLPALAQAVTGMTGETGSLTVKLENNVLKQGGEEAGTITFPADKYVKSGKIAIGKWEGTSFTADVVGATDKALVLTVANGETVYIDVTSLGGNSGEGTKEYSAGDGISINGSSINIDSSWSGWTGLVEGIKVTSAGTADVATKLGNGNVGTANKGIYLNVGIPTEMTRELNVSVGGATEEAGAYANGDKLAILRGERIIYTDTISAGEFF